MAYLSTQSLHDRLHAAIAQHIEDVREELIQESVKEYEKRLRKAIGLAAVNVADFYSVEMMGTVLQVRIQTEAKRG